MRAEEISAELGLRPIEEHLHEIASAPAFPGESIAMCTLRLPESGPHLRALLARAANGETLTPREERLFFVGLFILGGRRDEQSFPQLVRFLRRPIEEVDRLLGDAITESLAQIVSGMFDGDEDALFGMILDPGIDEFIRSKFMGAAAFLAWDGRIARERMVRFLERFYEERPAENGEYVWVGWLEAIALLGLRNLAPLVYSAWDQGRVPDGVLERPDFEGDLARAEAEPDNIDRFRRARVSYIDDVLETMGWLRKSPYFQRDPAEPETASDEDEDGMDDDLDLLDSTMPVINPYRHVGRNDPCPCGSGKKFKRCCGG